MTQPPAPTNPDPGKPTDPPAPPSPPAGDNRQPPSNTDPAAKIAALEEALRSTRSEHKAAQAELDKLKTSSMSEQEKAVASAKAEGQREATLSAGKRLAAAEFRATAAGRLADPAAAIELLDLAKFVGDDGEPDTKAIEDAVSKLVSASGGAGPKRALVPAGAREPAAGDGDFLRDAINGRG